MLPKKTSARKLFPSAGAFWPGAGSIAMAASQQGYALSFVFMMVLILSVFGLSVLSLSYFQKQRLVQYFTRKTAELAAENGMARFLAAFHSMRKLSSQEIRNEMLFLFDDGSFSRIRMRAWGALSVLQSEGTFHRVRAIRTALLADHPPASLSHALIFRNDAHSLVLAGSTSIKGDVETGPLGVTTSGFNSSAFLSRSALQGNVKRVQKSSLLPFDRRQILSEVTLYESLLSGEVDRRLRTSPVFMTRQDSETLLRCETIPDSIDLLVVHGNTYIAGSTLRQNSPLYLVIHGRAFIEDSTSLLGLVAVLADSEITIKSNATALHAIFYSRQSIQIHPNSSTASQFIAPSIRVLQHARARYPSLLLSMLPKSERNVPRSIVIEEGGGVEGAIIFLREADPYTAEEIVGVRPGAWVHGLLYSEAATELRGSVFGTVVTDDFFFYESPTSYYGWLKNSIIDRTRLSKGFLVPPGFSDFVRLDVVDWL